MSVFVDREKCRGCALCFSVCPVQAISIIDDKAFIDQKVCNACLQCMDECPTNAIRQTFEKEVYLTKSEPHYPDSPKPISLLPRESFSSAKWSPNAVKRDPTFINRLIRAVVRFFEFDPSPGVSGKGRKRQYRRHRGGHRGRRF